jgi:hypothetical protein
LVYTPYLWCRKTVNTAKESPFPNVNRYVAQDLLTICSCNFATNINLRLIASPFTFAQLKKIFTCVLLLIILAGSFYPCCMADDCCNDEIALTHGQEGDKSEGACSPFFACATCTGFVETAKPISIQQPLIIKKMQRKGAIVFDLTTYSTSFWQPPRTS